MHVLYSGPVVSSSPSSFSSSLCTPALTLTCGDALSADYSQEVETNYGVKSFVLP